MDEILKKTNKKIVPWFSMVEWRSVYELIYSDDVTSQQKGYEKMLVWKARCATLPSGIECTLSLIHVSLQDQELWPQIAIGVLPPYKEHDLRLMYSTAIMRFLNHISIVAQDHHETLYNMAKRVHIPDWVVNIRHDLAHGYNLPPLNVLRTATHFSLDWIQEHYWKGELTLASDYFATDTSLCDDNVIKEYFQEYIELYQALKLYSLQGYTTMKEIPDSSMLSQVRSVVDRFVMKRRQNLADFDKSKDTSSKDVGLNEIKSVQNQMLTHFDIFLARNKNSFLRDDLLVKLVLEGEAFLPSEDLFHSLTKGIDCQEGTLPSALRDIWQNILRLLPQTVFPTLLKHLIQLVNKKEETTHRCKMAAMWIKELCLSLFKANWIHKTVMSVKNNVVDNVPKEVNGENCKKRKKKHISVKVEQKIIEDIENLRPDIKDVIALNAMEISDITDLLKLILLSPNKWTKMFLPSFLDLVDPELSPSMKMKITELIRIYTSKSIGSPSKEQSKVNIYTISMLIKNVEASNGDYNGVDIDNVPTSLQGDFVEQEKNHTYTGSDEQQSLNWTKSETYLEWENCPLGILPWQKTENLSNISFTCDSTWTTSSPINTKKVGQLLPSYAHETIDWNNIQPKKKSLKKFTRRSLYLKRALELIQKE